MKCSPPPSPVCVSDRNCHKGTLDVFYKIIRQEGLGRLWRGTNASLALAVPTVGVYMPCYDIFRNLMEDFTTQNAPLLTPYVPLVAGSVARSLACITCYPVELARTHMQAFKETWSGMKPPGVWRTLVGVIHPVRSTGNLEKWLSGQGFWLYNQSFIATWKWLLLTLLTLGFMRVQLETDSWHAIQALSSENQHHAPSVLPAWCNLLKHDFEEVQFTHVFREVNATADLLAKHGLNIDRDPSRALNMTTRQTLREIWRDGRMRGLFTGVGPRVARAGPASSFPFMKFSNMLCSILTSYG